jgi:hypothetical protein
MPLNDIMDTGYQPRSQGCFAAPKRKKARRPGEGSQVLSCQLRREAIQMALPKRLQTTVGVEEQEGRWYVTTNVDGRERRSLGPFRSREAPGLLQTSSVIG